MTTPNINSNHPFSLCAFMLSCVLMLTACGGSNSSGGPETDNSDSKGSEQNDPISDSGSDGSSTDTSSSDGDSTSGDSTAGAESTTGDDNSAGSSDSDASTTGAGSNTDNNGSAGNSNATASWTVPVELENGSETIGYLKINKSGTKPVLIYKKGRNSISREFDGSNWSASKILGEIDVESLEFSSNNKGVLTYKLQNSGICELRYQRYDGNAWASNAVTFRELGGPQSYGCYRIKNLRATSLSNGSVGITFYRTDEYNHSRYNSCDSDNRCATGTTTAANTRGRGYIYSSSGGSDKSVLLYLDGDQLVANTLGANLSSGFRLSNTSKKHAVAMNESNNAIAIFNWSSTLKADYFDGNNWLSSPVDLGDTINLANHSALMLQQYMSKSAAYGLSLWNNGTLNNGDGSIRTNIYASNAFASIATLHSGNGVKVADNFAGAINNNGQAVIVWLEYTGDNSAAYGSLYARVYDGNQWLAKQVVSSDVKADYFNNRKGTVAVHLDDSGNATLVYAAKSAQDVNIDQKLFYSRISIQ